MQPALSSLIDMTDTRKVFDEVVFIMGVMFPGYDPALPERVFTDVRALFEGRYPGYRRCNTAYHDLNHTAEATLAMARLLHGASLAGFVLTAHNASLGIVCALLHDSGYIQTDDDTEGTGAKYTMSHIERSVRFAEGYFRAIGLSRQDFSNCEVILNCTGLNVKIADIRFASEEIALLGRMMGTADLLGQMADERYVEKLPILYREFKEGNVPGFSSERELMKGTAGFYDVVKKRCAGEFGGVDKLVIHHFRTRWHIDRDLYEEAVQANMAKLRERLRAAPEDASGPIK